MAQGDKLKILFVYDHEYPSLWRDGLWAALKILEKDFDIEYFNLREQRVGSGNTESCDFVLGWGGLNSPVDQLISQMNVPKGLCIGGNAFPYHPGYDVLFHETDWVKDYLKLKGNCVKAFGVNTDIYHPKESVKLFDVISVGAFASWKRQYLMTIHDTGLTKIAVGQIQRDNLSESMGIIKGLLLNGVMVSDMVHPEKLAELYRASGLCYIPADINGGGERAVLEARSCGIKVKVEDDNPKLKELLDCPIPTEYEYANALKQGILSVCA